MVPITITGRNEVTSNQKDHARAKVGKLERYFNGITRIDVVLDKMPERARAEVLISIRRGAQIVCRHEDKDLYAAIDLVLDKAETQLTRHKEKVQRHRPARGSDRGVEAGGAEEEIEDLAEEDFEDEEALGGPTEP